MGRKLSIQCLFLTVVTGCLISCGYQLGSVKPTAMARVKSVYVELPKNFTQYPRLEAKLTNHLVDALIQDTTYRVGTKTNADAVLKTSITAVDYTRRRAAITDGLRPEELEMKVDVNWQVVDSRSEKVIMSGKAKEDTRFFLADQRLTTARENAFPDALNRTARKIVSSISNSL